MFQQPKLMPVAKSLYAHKASTDTTSPVKGVRVALLCLSVARIDCIVALAPNDHQQSSSPTQIAGMHCTPRVPASQQCHNLTTDDIFSTRTKPALLFDGTSAASYPGPRPQLNSTHAFPLNLPQHEVARLPEPSPAKRRPAMLFLQNGPYPPVDSASGIPRPRECQQTIAFGR